MLYSDKSKVTKKIVTWKTDKPHGEWSNTKKLLRVANKMTVPTDRAMIKENYFEATGVFRLGRRSHFHKDNDTKHTQRTTIA